MIIKEVRSKLFDDSMRNYFYWANMDAMSWYETIKKEVNLPENDDIFQCVVKSFYKERNFEHYNPKKLQQDVCFILGKQDFLMGGESFFVDNSNKQHVQSVYDECGHYPHIESPAKFLKEIKFFLEK